jgi:hypothetical protein
MFVTNLLIIGALYGGGAVGVDHDEYRKALGTFSHNTVLRPTAIPCCARWQKTGAHLFGAWQPTSSPA